MSTPLPSPVEIALKMQKKAGLSLDMTEPEMEAMAEIAELLEFPRGSAVVEEDAKSRDLYLIYKGSVSVRLNLPGEENRDEIVYTMREGQIFGELALVDGSPRSATVRVEDPALVLRYRYERLCALLDQQPRIGYYLMRNIASIISTRVRNTNMLWRNSLIW